MNMKIAASLGAALVMALLIGAVLLYRANSIEAEARAKAVQVQLDNALEVNKQNAIAFRRFQLAQEENDKLLLTLADNIAAINANTVQQQSQLKQLANQNAEVKAYLTTKLPGAVSSLLNASANKAVVSK